MPATLNRHCSTRQAAPCVAYLPDDEIVNSSCRFEAVDHDETRFFGPARRSHNVSR